ncbi:MAG: DUF58 domain-containing protein [Candidatus Gygaella obscura]|nr:DUF58 domain-containing protein [Candidatus Gygaella obscura]
MLKTFIKKWVFIFVLLVFSFIGSLKSHIVFFNIFFWILLSIISLELLCVVVVFFAARFSFKRILPYKSVEDEEITIKTEVKNRSFLPCFNLVLEDFVYCAAPSRQKHTIIFEYIGPKKKVDLVYRCFCYKRGRYNIGPLKIFFFGPFGLAFFKRKYDVFSEIYVYPKTFSIQKIGPLTKGIAPWFGIETSRVSGDDDEFFGVREYKSGDPIKRIHWASTAKKNKLIVKEFQRQSFYRASIIFNLEKDTNFGAGREKVAEYMIKLAASIAKYFTMNGVSFEIISHIGEMVHIPFNKGESHLEEVMKFFTVAEAQSAVSLREIFEEFSRRLPSESSMIAIMQDTDWECFPAMMSLRVRNISLLPIVLVSSSFMDKKDSYKSAHEIKLNVSKAIDFVPIFVSCGDNLEELFLSSNIK